MQEADFIRENAKHQIDVFVRSLAHMPARTVAAQLRRLMPFGRENHSINERRVWQEQIRLKVQELEQ